MHLVSLLVIATAFWGQAPACGQPAITTAPLPVPVVGVADLADCTVTLDRRQYEAGEACMVALHEYAHLLGLRHSPDPNSIMYPTMQPPRWPCDWTKPQSSP